MVDLKQTLHFNYWLMVASEGLLERAATRADGRLREYYIQHLQEELDHASWLLDDLKLLGVTPRQDYVAAAIAGSQYYFIEHKHPAMLLGYMLMLESSPKPLELVARLEAKHGPLRTLRYHAEHDGEHTKDLEGEIKVLPDDLRADVMDNARWVSQWIRNVVETMDEEDL